MTGVKSHFGRERFEWLETFSVALNISSNISTQMLLLLLSAFKRGHKGLSRTARMDIYSSHFFSCIIMRNFLVFPYFTRARRSTIPDIGLRIEIAGAHTYHGMYLIVQYKQR